MKKIVLIYLLLLSCIQLYADEMPSIKCKRDLVIASEDQNATQMGVVKINRNYYVNKVTGLISTDNIFHYDGKDIYYEGDLGIFKFEGISKETKALYNQFSLPKLSKIELAQTIDTKIAELLKRISHKAYFHSKQYKDSMDVVIRDSIAEVSRIEDSIKAVQREIEMRRYDSIRLREDSIELALLNENIKKFPYGKIVDFNVYFNSANGVEPRFKFVNYSKKVVKYVTFYFSVYNRVNDICKLRFSSVSDYETSCRGIGPVEYLEQVDWDFDPVAYTNGGGHHIIVKKIHIQYMDGTTKTLTKGHF